MQKNSNPVGEYLTPKQLVTRYAPGLGERFIRDALKDPKHPLPHYRVNRKTILISRSAFDKWLEYYKEDSVPVLDSIVDDMCRYFISSKQDQSNYKKHNRSTGKDSGGTKMNIK